VDIGNETILRTILPGPDTSAYIHTPDLIAYFYEPVAGSPAPAPAVVLLGGSEGGISSTHIVAALLASHGYAALAVGYFGTIGNLPRTLENVPLEYFANAIAFLWEQPNVDASRLGVLGYSRGGELALLLGSYYLEFTAVVSYAGSGYVVAGYDPLVLDPADFQPAWTWEGEAIPFYPLAHAPTADELEVAEIPVERINGPVLLIAGDGDALWDSSALSQVAWDRLQRTEHPWPDQFLHYPGAGHGITAPYFPMTFDRQARFFGGDPLSDQIASVNSWRAVLNMLEWRLKHGG
jgi:dienelactone hydrolase